MAKGFILIVVYSAEVELDAALRRRLIRDSDFGRQFGWAVEVDGRVIARLEDSVWDANSQFWHHYRLVVLEQNPAEREAMLKPEWWDLCLPRLVFRNLRLGEIATGAFPSLQVFDENGRIWMRGLCLHDDADELPDDGGE